MRDEPAAAVCGRTWVDCGWGRLIFGHTFRESEELLECLRAEQPGRRDLAFYLRDPHVLLSLAPHELFLDPSHTYRLDLQRLAHARAPQPFEVRRIESEADAVAVRDIYLKRRMVPVEPEFLWEHRADPALIHLIADHAESGTVLGTVTGVDHVEVFDDPENGSSLWCLAVDPQASFPGVGRALVEALARLFAERGRVCMDLSVMHDNRQAIALYEELGFQRVPAFCVKHKNSFNESLYMGSEDVAGLNPYARILVEEARRRGISADLLDAENGYFRLRSGGRSIVCRESLTELTSAVAMSRCDDKRVTARLLAGAGLRVPAQVLAHDTDEDARFLERHGRVVVKPRRGEQGRGIRVDLRTRAELERAVEHARGFCEDVLIEELVEGQDLRVIVIGLRVMAAAVRRPAEVLGTGRHSVRRLIEKQSRRRATATGGESRIPLDDETELCVRAAGWTMDDVLPEGEVLRVRRTANLHTGGTIHDVTERLHPTLRAACELAARTLDIPVTGLDLMVPDVEGETYRIIEANERPGLANHEPQPTAEAFVDLLFPESRVLRAPTPSEERP
ncbi:MAG TPA: N-acetylglutaminylglutamine synthetase [Planctomycetota bacterium]|nr:N-acetylglutaminylglutamine synthetase [Planctomycetota bacterium]